MINIHIIQNFLKDILDPNNIIDSGINGIQVENDCEINKIAFAVDISYTSINMAIKNTCDLLIVHHGFFWGKPLTITGIFKERLKQMLSNNLGLIAYHLPLDSHPEYGNNIQILNKIGYASVIAFGNYKGNNIGWEACLNTQTTINDIYNKLEISINNPSIKYLNFGAKEIKKIAVVSGGGSSCFEEAINKKIDLFITGDADHTLFHMANEAKINILFAGHYFTETFGLKAIQKIISQNFNNIETYFCDIPTGL